MKGLQLLNAFAAVLIVGAVASETSLRGEIMEKSSQHNSAAAKDGVKTGNTHCNWCGRDGPGWECGDPNGGGCGDTPYENGWECGSCHWDDGVGYGDGTWRCFDCKCENNHTGWKCEGKPKR